MPKRQWNRAKGLATVDDMDMRIKQLNAKEKKYGLSVAESGARAYCYEWIEAYFTYEAE